MKTFLSGIIRLARPKQCSKNLLVFCGILLTPIITLSMLKAEFLTFIAFSLTSMSVYMLNDIIDLKNDRQHPRKQFRPLPQGTVTVPQAAATSALCLILGIAIAAAVSKIVLAVIACYYIMTTAYTICLKHQVIVDVMCVAAGFVLRAVAGITAAVTPQNQDKPIVTSWFLACIFFLALFLVLCKRRHERALLEDTAGNHRPVLDKYTIPLLDQMVSVATSSAIICYSLYVILGVKESSLHFRHPQWLVLTIPIVAYAILRYLYVVYGKKEGGTPEDILIKDHGMQLSILLFIAVIFALK